MKSMKKVIAGASALSLLAMNAIVFAANTGLSVSSTVYDDTTDTITVTVGGKDFTGDVVTSLFVRDSAGVAIAGVNAADVTEANGSFDVTDAALDSLAADTYSVAFVTTSGDFGAAIVNVGNDNIVNVIARVEPTLSFALDTNTLALGTLNSASYTSAAVTANIKTNAVNGADVTMTSAGLKDTIIDREIGVTDISTNGVGAENTTATDYYKVSTNAAPVITDVNDALANAGGTDMLASQVIYNGTTPTSSTNTVVTVGAKIASDTEAGNYSDTLTFTVTGSF